MTTVSVELADLEALIFVTGAIKGIEGALQTRKNDPFVTQHLPFTEAHDRLAQVMREAKRVNAGTAVDYHAPLDEEERNFLYHVREGAVPSSELSPADRGGVADRLAAKGMVEIGQRVFGARWGAQPMPELKLDPALFLVRLTERGRRALESLTL